MRMLSREFYDELEEFIKNLADRKDDYKILSFVLEKLGYIPEETKEYIARRIDVLPITLENTIKFYPKFHHDRQKRVMICIGRCCAGEGEVFYEKLEKLLQIDEEGVSKDRKWVLEKNLCFGRCQGAPVVSIDEVIYSHADMELIKKKMGMK